MVIRKKCLKLLVSECEIVGDHIDQIIKNKLFDKLNIYYVIPPSISHDNNVAICVDLIAEKTHIKVV